MKKLGLLFLSAAMALSLAACGESITGAAMELPETMEKGETLPITTEYTYSNGQTPDAAAIEKLVNKLGLSYTTSDPDILTVDENGDLLAVAAGTAEVTMASKDGKITETKTVRVVVSPTGIEMPEAFQMSMDQPEDAFTASVVPEDATDAKITYTSGDTDVLTVAEDGTITALKAGEATVTAAIDGTEVKSECVVTVLPSAEKITLSSTKLTLKPDASEQLTFTVFPENADTSHKVWYSSDESIATVDEDGNIKGVKDGTCEISLAMADQSAACKVTVSSKSSQSAAAAPASSAGAAAPSAPASGDSTNAAPAPGAGHGVWTVVGDPQSRPLMNDLRASLGLGQLSWSDSLGDVAVERCKQLMVDFSHNGMTAPEICAMNTPDAASTVAAWTGSSAHYAVMTNPSFTQVGIAHFYDGDGCHYWCACFG